MVRSSCPFCFAEIEGEIIEDIQRGNVIGTSFSFDPLKHCCLGVKGVLINDGNWDKHLELKSKEN